MSQALAAKQADRLRAICGGLMAWASPALVWAQSTPSTGAAGEVHNFMGKAITIGQELGLGLMIIGFIRVGMIFGNPDRADQGPSAFKNTVFGSVIIVGAMSIAQYIKGSFNAGRW